jgi:hypothetical protein
MSEKNRIDNFIYCPACEGRGGARIFFLSFAPNNLAINLIL